jgi:hypothetical protein
VGFVAILGIRRGWRDLRRKEHMLIATSVGNDGCVSRILQNKTRL